MATPSPTDPTSEAAEAVYGLRVEPGDALDDVPSVIGFDPAELKVSDVLVMSAEGVLEKAKGGSIGRMVRELLLDEAALDYPAIVEQVKAAFPQANTSTRSVASVAAALWRDGAKFLMRRKPHILDCTANHLAEVIPDPSLVDLDDLAHRPRLLNTTPRKCLGYRTPIEAFAANLGVALEL